MLAYWIICLWKKNIVIFYSVGDPDPIGSGLFGWPGSGSFNPIQQKSPVIQIFSVYKIV